MAFERDRDRLFHAIVLAGLLAAAVSAAQAESARPLRPRGHAVGPGEFFPCGTYAGSAIDAIVFDRLRSAERRQQEAASAAARVRMAGDLVIIEDDGTLITEPGRNAFDLDGRRLHFAPNARGGFEVTALPFAFDPETGTLLHPGDDTNHRVHFASGFSFPFAGQVWDHVWIRSNGNLTFGGIGNPTFYDPSDFFLALPMIAPLFADLNPLAAGTLHYRQAADRFTITWDKVPEFDTQNSNTFQVTLFADGSFDFVYHGVEIQLARNGSAIITGFTRGDPDAEYQAVDYDDLPLLGSEAAALFESFAEIPYRIVNTAAIARRFFAVQPDSFDQLVLITDFDLLGAPFGAFYQGVRNEVAGIGLGRFDFSFAYGSTGRLQGFLHMNYLNHWPVDPNGFSFLNVLGQEAEHEWGAYVRALLNGAESDLLLGRGLAHWSFFFDTDGSVMEGNGWRDNGEGTFTSTRAFDNFSLLDHYLMGLRPAHEIPPSFVINFPGVTLEQRVRFPTAGVTVSGSKIPVTIADIIAVEGERQPDYAAAPKIFRQAYIYLLQQGAQPAAADLAKAELFRASWPDHFARRTDGRGVFQTQLGPALPVAVVAGGAASAVDGSAVANLRATLVEHNFEQPVYRGGRYEFRLLAPAPAAAPETVTIVLQAFPFVADTSTVMLVYGETVQHDRVLLPQSQTELTGTVRDASGKPVRARLRLHASSEVGADFTRTADSDAQGRFAFTGLYASQPPALRYDRLEIEPEIPYARAVVSPVAIGLAARNHLDIVVAAAEVLLVNDDPTGAFEEFYVPVLEQLQLTCSVWRQAQSGPAPLSFAPKFKRQTIIWFTGNAAGAEVISAAEADSLTAHLNRGGRLFLTGQNIAESLNGTRFLSDRLHAAFDRNLNDPLLHGVQSDPVGRGLINLITAGALGANNQSSRDVLLPRGPAQACVVYDTTAGTAAGLRVEDPASYSRLVFFGFGFEAVNPGPGARLGYAGRAEVMQRVLDWLAGTTAVTEAPAPVSVPVAFQLQQSYPNPWRRGTGVAAVEFRYELPVLPVTTGRTVLRIFDVLGREVCTLVDQTYQPGHFLSRWDGRDRVGNLVSGGLYFCELQAGGHRQMTKLLLLR